MMSSLLYVTPAIRSIMGFESPSLQRVTVHFRSHISFKAIKRRRLFLVRVADMSGGQVQVMPLERQQSHMLSGAAFADGFIIIPENLEQISPEQNWEMFIFPWRRFPEKVFPE